MPRHSLEYPKEARNTVIRKGKDRGKYDLKTVHTIIQNGMVAHVAFSPSADDPFPAVLPMIAVLGSYERPSAGLDEPLDCYLHGYVSSRIMNLARSTQSSAKPKESPPQEAAKGAGAEGKEQEQEQEEQEQEEQHGIPLTITCTKIDGLVLSLTPNSHSLNYRSATLFGYAYPVPNDPLPLPLPLPSASTPTNGTDSEKLFAMKLITQKILPQRWENSRTPPTPAEMASTQILRVKIVHGSAKVRDGGPGDLKPDLEDEALRGRVWTGYVPVREVLGEGVRSVYDRVGGKEGDGVDGGEPEYINDWREGFNRREEEYVERVGRNVREAGTAAYS